ncbi:MAG TPA: hypothetical protein VNY29_17255 [Terriglobales bacterium]|nr:hypothetical protein [Terriglobales bacterium]
MKDMATHREIEAAISGLELENALVLEGQPGCEIRVPLSRKIQVLVNDVNSEHLGAGKEFGQARRAFASAASSVEYVGLGRERITTNHWNFLRPNRAGLRIQAAYHRLVGHLFRLWIQIGHCGIPALPK